MYTLADKFLKSNICEENIGKPKFSMYYAELGNSCVFDISLNYILRRNYEKVN